MIKIQSAMEYLMTYGWAILVIAVVLGALYQLGVFNSNVLGFSSSCLASAGFLCQNPTLNSSGSLAVKFGQIGLGTITITNTACTTNVTAPTSTQSTNTVLTSGQSSVLTFTCPLSSTSLGTNFKGYIWLTYSTQTQSGVVDRIAVVTSKVSTLGSSVAVLGGTVGVPANNYVYCTAGITTGGISNTYYSAITSSGTGAWTSTNSYPLTQYYHACVAANGDIYCIGGISAPSTAYYAPLTSYGVGAWTSTTAYPGGYDYGSCNTDGSYVYCLRGLYTSGVSYAQLSAAGIGAWTSTNSYPLGILYYDSQSCSIFSGYIYCIGGFDGTTNHVQTYYAPLYGAGGVGVWTATTSYPIGMGGISCVTKSGYIYCIGGTGASGYSAVYYAPISSGGIGTWVSSNTYPTITASGSCVIKGSYIYCGVDSTSNYYYAPMLNPGIGAWTATNSYPLAPELTECVTN